MIKRRGRRTAHGRIRRIVSAAAGITLAGAALSACASASAGTGPVALNFYLYPDTSGATEQAIGNCNAQSHGAYTISYQSKGLVP
jgi:multiple sugar transport system substrate-binding protein